MAEDFVWAIDENGKPTKCKAKPENRGKRNCKHKFHALPGQSQKEFFNQFMIGSKNDLNVNINNEDGTLPNYSETIEKLVKSNNEKYSSWAEVIENNYVDYFNSYDENGNVIEPAVHMSIVGEDIDPNDPTSTLVKINFEYDGKTYEQEMSIPRVDEKNQIYIYGNYYRSIPTFFRNKKGISITDSKYEEDSNKYVPGKVFIKSDNNEVLAFINKDTGILTMDKQEVDIEDFEKFVKGEPNNLTDDQKNKLKKLDEIAINKIKEHGLRNLIEMPADAPNDISDKELFVYQDRVAYTIGKQMRATGSVFRKNKKNGYEQTFSLANINDNIRKDLMSDSTTQLADNLNPIAALSQSEKITFVGSGVGYSRDGVNAVPELRLMHESYRGIIDTTDLTSGGGIGTTMALKGRINSKGMLEKDNRITGSDFVPYLENSDPQRAIMAVAHMKQAVPIVGGEDPHLSTKAWDKIKGSKLGANMNVVYMASAGTFDDATVISESAAKKFTTIQTKKYELKNKPKQSYSVGDEILKGIKIGGAEIKYGGKIKAISDNHIEIETTYPMTVGDKIAGRHGNKQVISQILPDKDMPKINGKPADMIMSPIGVSGRANLGQVYEVNGDKDLNKKHKVEFQGRTTENTAGEQFVMRLNHIAEKKLQSASNELDSGKNYKGGRLGEMENIVLTQTEDRLKILNYIKHQEHQYGEEKFLNLMKSIGVNVE